jgi:hypothetical protein
LGAEEAVAFRDALGGDDLAACCCDCLLGLEL